MKISAQKNQKGKALEQSDLLADPVEMLQRWLEAAEKAGMVEPTAMVLATATPDAKPSARVVLLKSIDANGLVFFSNYESRKGKELRQNPSAALLFFWDILARQVRVEGRVSVIPEKESYEYFKMRPFMSRIGAWASKQSEVLSDRSVLEAEVERLAQQFEGRDVPLPPHWGGFRLVPNLFEFWQGRESRLHDRFQYVLAGQKWKIERLSP